MFCLSMPPPYIYETLTIAPPANLLGRCFSSAFCKLPGGGENRRPRGPTGAQAGNRRNSTILLDKTYAFSRGGQNSGIQGPKGPTGAHAGILTIKLKKS